MMSVMMTNYLIYLILLLLPFTIHGQTLYGGNQITPLIEDGKPVIHLPGGVTVNTANDNDYIVSNHLGQDIKSNTAPFWANKSLYEPETSTFNNKARQYDPSTGRFLSVDSAREGDSPYVYVGNNPIGFIDIDGNGKVSLLLFSGFDFYEEYPSEGGRATMEVSRIAEGIKIANLGLPVVNTMLERMEPIGIKYGDTIDHIIVRAHGLDSGKIDLLNKWSGRHMAKTGRDFGTFLLDTIYMRHPQTVETVERITIASCLIGCPQAGQEKSFVQEFADSAKRYFPKLKQVVGSSYEFGIMTRSQVADHAIERKHIQVNVMSKTPGEERLKYVSTDIKARQFYLGKLPNKVYRIPDSKNIDSAFRTPNGINTEPIIVVNPNRTSIRRFLREGGFDDPFFIKIPIVRE